uniref:RecA family profile 1 domain-containing protein n=1 Tax=Leersia perrieri TaxID=77586 RepID=A0A0D9XWU7_9ORYZ
MAPSKQYDEGGQLQLMDAADRIEEEGECFESIDKLTRLRLISIRPSPLPPSLISQGINSGDVKKLQDAGIYTCNGLMMHTKKSLTGIKGLSEAKVDKICEAAEKLLSQEVISLLRSGKTQLAHTLCVSTQLPIHMHGGNGKVAYIDTEGTFRPERIVPIAERFGMDANAVLDNIIYARAYTYEHQYNLLLGLAAKMAEEPFRLLIVDSVIALFRVDFSGRGELAERQQKLAQMLSRLTKIAEEFNVAVYITNQVIADPGGGMFITDPKKPAGGHVLAHAATIRLMLRKGKGEQLRQNKDSITDMVTANSKAG